MHIRELNLSVRAYNCLMRSGITTIEELSEKTAEDMMRVRNLGRSSLTEILNVMKTHGLSFKESEVDE